MYAENKLFSHFYSRTNYKGYALESRLHFKIHAAHNTIKRDMKGSGDGSPAEEDSLNGSIQKVSEL